MAIVSKSFEGKTDRTEQWYGTQYKQEAIPEEVIQVGSGHLRTSSWSLLPCPCCPRESERGARELEGRGVGEAGALVLCRAAKLTPSSMHPSSTAQRRAGESCGSGAVGDKLLRAGSLAGTHTALTFG